MLFDRHAAVPYHDAEYYSAIFDGYNHAGLDPNCNYNYSLPAHVGGQLPLPNQDLRNRLLHLHRLYILIPLRQCQKAVSTILQVVALSHTDPLCRNYPLDLVLLLRLRCCFGLTGFDITAYLCSHLSFSARPFLAQASKAVHSQAKANSSNTFMW